MNCEELQQRVRGGTAVDGDRDIAAHLRGCEACAAMLAAAPVLHMPSEAGAGAAPAWAELLAAIDQDDRSVAQVRSWSTPHRLALGMVAMIVVPLVVALAMPRPDLGGATSTRGWIELAALAASIGFAAALVLRPVHRPRRSSVAVGAAGLSAAVIVAMAAVPHDHGASIVGGDRLAAALGCLVFGTLCAVPAWVVLRMLARDGDRLGPRATLVAAASAAVGAMGTVAHCPVVHPLHLWLGHVTVLVLPWAWAIVVMRRAAR